MITRAEALTIILVLVLKVEAPFFSTLKPGFALLELSLQAAS